MTPRRFRSYLLLLLRLLPAEYTAQESGGPIQVPHERQCLDHQDNEQIGALILPQLILLTISGKGEVGHAYETCQIARYVRRFRRHIVTPFLIPGLVASCLLELYEKFGKLSQDLKQMTQIVAEKNHEISIAHFEQSRIIAKLLQLTLPGQQLGLHLQKLQQSIISPMPLAHYSSMATDDPNQMYLKLWRLYKVLVQNVFAKNCDIDLAAFQQNALCSRLLTTGGQLNRDVGIFMAPEQPSHCSATVFSADPVSQSLAKCEKPIDRHPLAGSAPVRLCWDDFDSE